MDLGCIKRTHTQDGKKERAQIYIPYHCGYGELRWGNCLLSGAVRRRKYSGIDSIDRREAQMYANEID